MNEKNKIKEPAPKEFVPTELGSAVFASIDGQPDKKEFLVLKEKNRDDNIDRTKAK